MATDAAPLPINDYKQLVDSFAQAVWETDAHGQVLTDSPSWRAYTGQSLEQWLGEGWVGAIHPDDRAYALHQWQEAVRCQTPVNAEFRLRNPDGGWRWTNVRASCILEADGSVKKWLGLNLNIQDRKQAQETRQKSEESLMAAAMGTFVWYIDEDRGQPDAQMLTLFGLPSDSTLNLAAALGSLIHPDDGPGYAQAVAQAADPAGNGQLRHDIRVIHPDGKERWLTIRGQMHFAGSPRRAQRLVGSAIDITERKRAEQNLKGMLQGATAAICILQSIRDEQGHIIDFLYQGGNRAAEKILGQPVEAMVGKTLLQLWPGVKDIFFDSYVRVVETGEPFRVENQYAYEEFDHWFEISGEKNGDGFVMTFHDVTSQKKAEEALQRSEARQRYLLQLGDRLRSLTDPVQLQYQAACVLGEFLGANRVGYAEEGDGGHLRLTAPSYTQGVSSLEASLEGPDQNELYAATMLVDLQASQVVVHPDVANDARLTAWQQAAHQAIQVGASLYHPLVKEGQLVAVLFIHYQQAHSFSAQERELVQETAERTWAAVERAKALEALRQSEEQFRLLGIASSDSIYKMSPDWLQMRGLNGKTFLADTHHPSASWLETYIPLEDQERVQRAIQAACRTQRTFELEHRVRQADGRVGWTFSRAIPVFDGQGVVQEWLGAASDITSRKQAEADLLEADRRKDEFLAMLAHELRNPMATIHSGLQLLTLTVTDELTQSTVAMMNRQTNHLVRMLDDLLDVSRISQGKITLKTERVNLVDIAQQTVESLQPLFDQQGKTLSVHLPSLPIELAGDTTRLTQVMTNLLTNSLRYTDDQGKVWLAVGQEQGPEGRRQATIQVRDNGIGLAADHLSSIFELFVQADQATARSTGGLGVGLTLVRRLVELHGGRVEAQSQGVGQGSTFTVYLPTLTALAQGTGKVLTEPLGKAGSWRILVIDDNADAAMILGMLLKRKGYEAYTRTSGQAGIEAAEELQPAAILLDLGMPGLDGYETCRLIRQHSWGRALVIIALTGYGQAEDRQRTKEAGFNGHLVKPVDLAVLTTLLTDLLGKHSTAP